MSRAPIFVLGATPRSGTNLLWDLLRLHPDCSPAREPIWEDDLLVHADLLEAYSARTAASWHDVGDRREVLRAELLERVGDGLLGFLSTDPERRLLTKTPHVHNLGLFFELFPSAHLLLLVRDGRAVVRSARDTFGGTLEGWARHWARAVDAILAFDDSHVSRIVRFEDLVDDRRSAVHDLLGFLQLDPDVYDFEAAMDLPVRGSSALRRDGVIDWAPIRPGQGFDPTARFASWSPRAHRRFNWIAGRQLAALGYEPLHAGDAALRRAGHRARDLAWAASRPLRTLRARLTLEGGS